MCVCGLKKKIYHPGFHGLETSCRALQFRPFGEEEAGPSWNYQLRLFNNWYQELLWKGPTVSTCMGLYRKWGLDLRALSGGLYITHCAADPLWFADQIVGQTPFHSSALPSATPPSVHVRMCTHTRTHTHICSVKALQWLVGPCPLTPHNLGLFSGIRPSGAEPGQTNYPLYSRKHKLEPLF